MARQTPNLVVLDLMRVRRAPDHVEEAQATELTGDGAAAVGLGRAAFDVGEVLAQVGVTEAVSEQTEQPQGVPQSLDLGGR